jgi:small multidrug resistance pump
VGWLLLTVTILAEVAGTVCLKLSDGFRNPLPSVLIFVFYGISFTVLVFVVKHLPISVAYAVWAGVGTALITFIGMTVFREPASILRVVFIGLIIVGVVGLNFVATEP